MQNENANQVQLQDIQMPLQENRALLQENHVPLQDNHMPLTPEKTNVCSPPVTKPTLNPFITAIEDDIAANHVEPTQAPPIVQIPAQPIVHTPAPPMTNQMVSTSTATSSSRPPLPPVPPRQRSFRSTEPIRIPIHIVRPKKEADVVNIINNNNNGPITSNALQSKPVPEIHETSKQNGNGDFNHNTIDMNNHETPCPCKSGAHPKQPNKCQENGNGNGNGPWATPARHPGKSIDSKH